jgi:hypothetical protein
MSRHRPSRSSSSTSAASLASVSLEPVFASAALLCAARVRLRTAGMLLLLLLLLGSRSGAPARLARLGSLDPPRMRADPAPLLVLVLTPSQATCCRCTPIQVPVQNILAGARILSLLMAQGA